jgi:hypothetical protein
VKWLALAVAALAVTGCGQQEKRCASPANPYGAAPANWTYAKPSAEQRERVMRQFRLHAMEKYGDVEVKMAFHADSADGVLFSLKRLSARDVEAVLEGIEQVRDRGRAKVMRHWVGDTNTRVIVAPDGSEMTIAPKGCTVVFAGGVDRDSAAALAEAVFG